MFCYKVLQWNNKKTFSLGANCLICNGAKPWGLDLSRLRLLIFTSSNSSSQEWRKYWHFQKVCLDSQEILIEIKISQFCLDINVRTQDPKVSIKKSVKIWKFCHFLKLCLNLDQEVKGFLHISCQDFLIRWDFSSFSCSKCLHFLTNLNNLDSSQQSLQKSRQDKVSILKILTETKKKFVLTDQEISILISICLNSRDHQA